jgi:hypothetical protein
LFLELAIIIPALALQFISKKDVEEYKKRSENKER